MSTAMMVGLIVFTALWTPVVCIGCVLLGAHLQYTKKRNRPPVAAPFLGVQSLLDGVEAENLMPRDEDGKLIDSFYG